MRKKKSAFSEIPKISDAEWVVMQVVWDLGEATANAVVEALEGAQDWRPKTIHTLLRRLADKGALGFEKNGREYLFHALISRDDAERAQSQSFVRRFFNGETTPFLARFIENEDFSAEEIEELKSLLERKSR